MTIDQAKKRKSFCLSCFKATKCGIEIVVFHW